MSTLIPIIQAFGYAGIFGAVFAESGLLLGMLLPGDTLLFAAGLLASKGVFNVMILCIGCFIAAVLGDTVGYWTGKKFGPRVFNKEESFFFKKEYVARAERFFQKYGKKTIFLARFVPIVRTLAPIVAGIGNMKYGTFLSYNIAGGFVWCFLLIPLGYFLGTKVPNIDAYILPIVLGIFLLSLVPIIKEFISERRTKR